MPASFQRFSFLCAVFSFAVFAMARAQEPKPEATAEFDPAHAEKMREGLDLFKSQVRSVLIETCIDCHGGEEVESGFDLATRKGLVRGGAKGPAVIPGKSGDSNLVRFISHREEPKMPDGGDKLPPEQIAAISRWIDLGAPYDKPLVENPRDPDRWTNTVIPETAREFWAFQPLAKVEPPPVQNPKLAAWVRNPIDQFILQKLEEKGLTPNPPAELRVLIRRAYFDLIGLPPTAETEENYDQVIDKLLDSPHYGERWARHWLDAARFAESHGFEQDYDRPYAYHYRDFVIKAFNQDMPYDQFVQWQIAGDEIAREDPLALMATGFLGAGVFPTQITANEVERTRYDALDDMAATTGSAMLGLSIGCARCHDHKFDPIPQADYYRFISTFTTTVRSNIDVNLDPGPYKIAKAAFDKEHQPLVDALNAFEREQLPSRLAEWEKSAAAAELRKGPWIVLDLENPKSFAGGALTKQDDGSLLASGTNPDTDTFTFSAKTAISGVTTIRVEALADPLLAKGGPGRAENGNFALTDLKVKAKTEGADSLQPLKLQKPRATFEQPGLPIVATIDENETSGWAVDPQFGKSHAAVYELAEPLSGAATFSFQLDFKNNKQHAIGRLRISVSTAGSDAPLGPETGIPEKVLQALDAPAEKRTAEQTAALSAWYRHHDAEWQKLHAAVAEHERNAPQPNLVKVMVCSEGVTPIRHHTQGGDFLNETHFLKRGDCDQKMGVAEQGFLQVLTTAPNRERHWQAAPPPEFRTSYRRRALAGWITDQEYGAGHLLARVIVNRLWHHHFGRGIVTTPNDFGVQGARPTHPELLDWLAAELIRNNWQLKPIHKLIMTSGTYMQSAAFDEADARLDPDNIWLWRRTPRRLEAEIVRDNMLAVSGALDRTMYGPGTLDEGHKRRSLYFMIKRSKLVPMMQLFDQPEPLVSVGGRPSTTIAPQALAFLNSPHVRGYAHSFAQRLLPEYEKSPAAAIKFGYQTAISREPDDVELASALEFLATQEKLYAEEGKPDARKLALADFCQVLFGLNEFVYME